MGSFIAKQPNGLYCRFSTSLNYPTHWNMTANDYIDFCVNRAKEEAKETLKHHLRDFQEIKDRFTLDNMTGTEYLIFLESVEYKGDKRE